MLPSHPRLVPLHLGLQCNLNRPALEWSGRDCATRLRRTKGQRERERETCAWEGRGGNASKQTSEGGESPHGMEKVKGDGAEGRGGG